MVDKIDTSKIDSIIFGRVEPYIYAFETNTVPNFLKVGDTYRPVNIRLAEWRKIYSDLEKKYEHIAKVDENTYFRDYSVHDFLIKNGYRRIEKDDVAEGVYCSNEFFLNAKEENVEDAINDIQNCFDQKQNTYDFYDVKDKLPLADFEFNRDAEWIPRENQQEVIEKFSKAVENGRNNLLMFAVMRFGKSFTSLCCAKAMNAKLIVVVCGKTAVRLEWKENVQRSKMLDGFCFVDSESMVRNPAIVSEKLKEEKAVVVFLTMQDLIGEDIKEKHKDLFSLNEQEKIDLLIIDETHFGARAEEYGKVLGTSEKIKGYDENLDDLDSSLKLFLPKVKLHLSGTPYRILLDNEFESDDIVGTIQYSDIIEAKEKWDKENIDKDEWENPYYGFPQMIRFAFNLNESAKAKLETLKNNGYAYDLNELLSPESTSKDDENHNQFKYKDEVLDLLKAIDGTKEDENIFSFLNYDKINDGKMCRHIVMVLPYCASCDAMETLLKTKTFNRLNEYEIINIAGFDSERSMNKPDYASRVKEKIEKFEAEGKRTISLTVGKMLTGCTVKEWDTMIFLRNTASPQDYDQAIFRLQSQYVKTLESDEGKIIKYDMKPQTILVDFDPVRMYTLQHKKSLIANINKSERGNENLEEKLKKELRISPIICMNHSKLQEVEPNDIVDSIRKYNAKKSMMDETFEIGIDERLFDDDTIKLILQKQPELTANGVKFEMSAFSSDEETDLDSPNTEDIFPEPTPKPKEEHETNQNDDETKELSSKLQGYYFKLLLFAFLSDVEIKTVSDIINNIESCANEKRIGENLQINVAELKYIRKKINPAVLSYLEDKIHNINQLGKEISPDKISIALNKMSRLSVSEVVTPDKVAKEMVNNLPDEVTADCKFLDIASKTGEFANALLQRYGENVKNNIYSIPTSKITYECTRKIYKLLGMPIENVFNVFTSYDLIDKTKNEELLKELKDMNFDTVIGNPPYQAESERRSVNGQNPRTNIFHLFQILADKIVIRTTALIYPAGRWIHRSGKGQGLAQFGLHQLNNCSLEKIIYYEKSQELFKDIGLDDGLSIVYKNMKKEKEGFEYIFRRGDVDKKIMLSPPGEEMIPLNPQDIAIVNKISDFVRKNKFNYIHDRILSRSLFGIESDFVEKNKEKVKEYHDGYELNDMEVKLFTNDKAGSAGRAQWFVVNKDLIKSNKDLIDEFQVVVSSAHPGGQAGRCNYIDIIDNKSAFGRSRLALSSFKTMEEARNFFNYCNTNLIKFMFLMTDESLTSLGKRVPDVGNYSFSNHLIDFRNNLNQQLYSLVELTNEEILYIETIVGK